MERTGNHTPPCAPRKAAPAKPRFLNRTVTGAGVTSALGDFCFETSNVILPGFLAVLGLPAVVLGFIEGFADAVASFMKMAAGYIADKLGHRKVLVVAGYALTPAGQMLIALATGWPLILLGRSVSWFGKGMRGPLRDAIISGDGFRATRGRAFGFHRAMDTVGAVAGPLPGVALLGWAQKLGWADVAAPFRLVFWLTIIPGVLAALVFLVLVNDPGHAANPELRFFSSLRALPARFRRYLGAVGLFGLGDFSHSLLILAATGLFTPLFGAVKAVQVAGLFYVVRNVVQVLASYPVGVLADWVGARKVLIGGYALGALTALATVLAYALPSAGFVLMGAVFLLAGLYMAVQETVEAAITADMAGAEVRALSYGVLGTVNGTAKFISSAGVGALWTAVSPQVGFGVAALLMAGATIALARLR